jgi:probable F420-dependent oxidoreductase
MRIGTAIRNMGPAATTSCMRECAEASENAGLDHIWVVDHIAIPPEESEGSDGRWIDPLAVLSWLAAATRTIKLGVSVLVLPYRPALPTAKWVASIQELSEGRLLFGIGPGWMEAEYTALGVEKKRRGAITDEVISFIKSCFNAEDDVVSANGQQFLFRPRPTCPPIYVGGMTDAALERTIKYGDGWLPVGIDPEKLRPRIEKLKELAEKAGRPTPDVIMIGGLPESQNEAMDQLGACAELGACDFIQNSRYTETGQFEKVLERLVDLKKVLQ